MFGFFNNRKKIIMFTFGSTVITGVFSMAFSKSVIEHEGVVSGSKSFMIYTLTISTERKLILKGLKGKR